MKRIYKSDYFAFIIMFVLLTILHLFMDATVGDYIWFKDTMQQNTISEFLINRYNDWTSRIIIEFILASLIRFPIWIFKILNICVMTGIPILISKLFIYKNKREMNCLIVSLVLIIY